MNEVLVLLSGKSKALMVAAKYCSTPQKCVICNVFHVLKFIVNVMLLNDGQWKSLREPLADSLYNLSIWSMDMVFKCLKPSSGQLLVVLFLKWTFWLHSVNKGEVMRGQTKKIRTNPLRTMSGKLNGSHAVSRLTLPCGQ